MAAGEEKARNTQAKSTAPNKPITVAVSHVWLDVKEVHVTYGVGSQEESPSPASYQTFPLQKSSNLESL